MLLLSLQRALIGEVHAELRQASIEPSPASRESCSCAAAEVIADFPAPWQLDEQHVAVPLGAALLALAHVAYRRAEPQHEA